MISVRHGWVAFMLAVLVHVLALGLFFATPSEGAKDKGEQGVEVDLGMLGNLGESLNTTEDVPAESVKELPQEELPKELPKEEVQTPEPDLVVQPEVPEPPKQKVALKVKKAPKIEKKQIQVTSKKVPVDSPPSSQQALLPLTQKKAKTHAHTKAQKKISTGVGNSETTGGNPGAERSYFTLLAATLAKNKRYPTASRRKGEEGIVVLTFVVDRFGGVTQAQIKTSSGYSRLDAAVLRMLKKSRRLPAFPADMKQAQLLINIPISFELSATGNAL